MKILYVGYVLPRSGGASVSCTRLIDVVAGQYQRELQAIGGGGAELSR